MAPRPYTALTVLTTPHGSIAVRKHFSEKQRTWLLIFAGPQAALRLALPRWRPRSDRSQQTQLTPETPIGSIAGIIAWWRELEPKLAGRIAASTADSFSVTGTSPPPAPSYRTLGEVAELVQREVATSVRPSSAKTYERHWSTLRRFLPDSTPLADLTRERLQNLVAELVAQGRSPATIRNLTVSLGRALARAVEDRVLPANPMDRVRLPAVIARSRQVLTREQRDHLISVAAQHGRDIHLVVALASLSGVRRAELLALRWEHVDLRKRVLKVENTDTFTTKSGRSRTVPICTKLLAILTRYHRHGGYVVRPSATKRPGPGRWHFTRAYASVLRDAQVPRTTIHGLRHVFASIAAETLPLPRLKALLGHHSVRVTERYCHLSERFGPEIDLAVG